MAYEAAAANVPVAFPMVRESFGGIQSVYERLGLKPEEFLSSGHVSLPVIRRALRWCVSLLSIQGRMISVVTSKMSYSEDCQHKILMHY